MACRGKGTSGMGEKPGLDQGEMPNPHECLVCTLGAFLGGTGGAEPGPAPRLQADWGLRPLAQLPRSHGHFKA